MREDIQIVFIHQGKSWYLPYTLRQAVSVNRSFPQAVTLLGDTALGGSVATIPLEQLYSPRGDHFLERYEHMSTNPERFERFCWLRWFYLLRYMELAEVTYVLYVDSDVLLYSSRQEFYRVYGAMRTEGGFFIAEQDESSFLWAASGHMSYWTRALLEAFCDFALQTFSDARFTHLYRQKWAWHQATHTPGGICDMTTLFLFWREHPHAITNLAIEVQGSVCDLSVSASANYRQNEYIVEGDHKKIQFIEKSKPAFFKTEAPNTPIAVHGIHFQGQAKQYIPTYFSGRKALSMYRQKLWNMMRRRGGR
jgi:hypothetical protein